MSDKTNDNNKRDIIITVAFIIMLVSSVSLLNYIVDPYYIFKDSTIKGFNNIKTHKYTNKRTILYSDLKINNKNKDTVFVGNCVLSRYNIGKDNIAFYTIPIDNVDEVVNIIKNVHLIAPHIKKIYWGLFFQDLWFDENDEKTDKLNELDSKNLNLNDFLNLFFSWNTTKYSLETIKDSVKNKGNNIEYIYPYKEIAIKKYDVNSPFEKMNFIKETVEFAKDNGIELVIYYSPVHVTKKIHMYENNVWDKDIEFKKRLADITPFYDYSLLAENHNMEPLDENSKNFIDNIHPTEIYNNIIVEDILSDNKNIGILITKDNVDKYTKEDTKKLLEYIAKNQNLTDKIKNIKPEDSETKIKKNNSNS